MIRRFAKYITVFGIVLLVFFGCKKNNHDTIVPLGDEHYMKTIDEIYPRKYRFQWPAIDQTGYYRLSINGSDTTLNPPLFDGVYPPDLRGEFLIKGIRKGGNETLHYENPQTHEGYDVSYYDPLVYGTQLDGMYIILTIKEQKNAYAKVLLKEYNNYSPQGQSIETDDVFLYGDGSNGQFALCFDGTVPMGGALTLKFAYLMTGVFDTVFKQQIVNDAIIIDTVYGIKDMRFWQVVKGREGESQMYINTGGQRFYMDSVNFAERVLTIDEIENE